MAVSCTKIIHSSSLIGGPGHTNHQGVFKRNDLAEMLTALSCCSDPALPLGGGQGCGLPGPRGWPAGSGGLLRVGQARPAHAPDEPPAALFLEVSSLMSGDSEDTQCSHSQPPAYLS